jgi:Ig domain of plant-specific actin-binding protein
MSWIKRIAVLAGALAVTASVLVGVGSAVGQAVPSNTSLPSISGSAKDGSLLSASNGSWTNSPTSFAYAWQRCDNSGGSCAAIAGATSKQYTLTSAEVNQRIRVQVTATNSSGSGTATSGPTNTVQATGQAPKNTSAPTISGTQKEGSVLTVSNGGWTGTNPIKFTYQWQRCDATSGNCVNIAGATNQNYTAASVDVATVLRANVTASNSKGSTAATSQETGIIAPATTGSHAIPVSQVSLPSRLIIDGVKFAPTVLTSRAPAVARFHVSDTRGFSIQGALVYALGLPYGWMRNSPEVATDTTGWATITISPTANMPLRPPGALVIFVRARKAGDDLLAGVSTRRLVQVSIR